MAVFNLPAAARPQAVSAADRKFVLDVAKRIEQLMNRQPPYWLARLRLIIQELLLHFVERMGQVAPTRPADRVPGRDQLLPVLLLVERYPHRVLTLGEAARAVHMGRSKFAAIFHQAMGVPFARYLQRRRLAGVMRDLRGTDDKLSVLAERWGFTDAPHLVRVFKGVVGQTPMSYRQTPRQLDRAGESAAPRMPRPRTVRSARRDDGGRATNEHEEHQ